MSPSPKIPYGWESNGVQANVENRSQAVRANKFPPPGRMDLSRPRRARLTPAVVRGTLGAIAVLSGS